MSADALEVVADVATVKLGKRGHVVRVQVKDAGNGHGAAVDVREYVTAEAHQWRQDRKYRDLNKGRRVKDADIGVQGYVGHTAKGWWLYPTEALALWEALGQAIEIAAQHAGDGPEARSTGAERWEANG